MDINEYDKKMMEVITTPEMARAVSYAINGLTEDQLFRNGNLLRKIIIEGESGYFDLPNAYHDNALGQQLSALFFILDGCDRSESSPFYRTLLLI